MVYVGSQFTNLFLNDSAPATQDITVTTGTYTIRPRAGSGYTVTTAAGTATGSGFGEVAIGASQTMTITAGGTVTVTIAGTPVGAKITFVAGPIPGPYIPTAGSAVTHNVDQVIWTTPVEIPTTQYEMSAIVAPYLWNTYYLATAKPHPFIAGNGGVGRSAIQFRAEVVNTPIQFERETNPVVGAHSSYNPVFSSGKTKIVSLTWRPGFQGFSIDGSAVTESALANPFAPFGNVQIGHRFSDLSHCGNSAISVLATPGGLTNTERTVLANAFAGRVLVWGA
jgi:hypothetical protein